MLYRRLERTCAERRDLESSRHPLEHAGAHFELLRIASRGIGDDDPVVLVRAGVHGDERAGPLCLARHLGDIADHAHARGVKLVVYPLGNPSGYALGLRYNAEHDPGAEGNNDFLRYELDDGRLVGSLPSAATAFRAWHWSSELDAALPAETRLMHRLLRADPLAQVRGALDLHQDHLSAGAPPGAYHYAFGDVARFRRIVAAIAAICPLLAGVSIGAGFGTRIDGEGRIVAAGADGRAATSDAMGFIVRHDGTLTDLCHRLGVAHAVAPETTGATPMSIAVRVNLAWITGIVDLVARERTRRACR